MARWQAASFALLCRQIGCWTVRSYGGTASRQGGGLAIDAGDYVVRPYTISKTQMRKVLLQKVAALQTTPGDYPPPVAPAFVTGLRTSQQAPIRIRVLQPKK
jgi:hypothetical protein